MSEEIKNTSGTAAGYIYQYRQGLRLLCDWLDAPGRYTRVKFECDDETVAPMGLDDIVVERADGLIDLQQVKFTLNADAHTLCWDWMLEKAGKTKRSRSMLRKWFDAFKALDPARIGILSLRTNRRPDADIEACLDGGKISFTKISEPRRSEVIAELGNEKNCEAFFSQLYILHSDKGFETLEQEVDARLRKHGTLEGIGTLKNVALNWAMQRNFPPPEGWITLEQVRAILRSTPPAPLPEDFVVPQGYEVPDEMFHQEFVRDAVAATGKTIVLTGPPGRGKSTYLSALCDKLAEENIPAVRHHYFLSTTERGRDRVNSYAVEQSIAAQVDRFHPDVHAPASDLRSLLEACASHYKEQGKPFVLVLDGLDHVWRMNAADKRPLDDVFSQVIPCPDNMVLLVGTQPIDDAQLPTDLLTAAPKAEWRTLPAMSENAVLSYLRKAVQEGRLTTSFEGVDEAERQLQEGAAAIRTKTNGHPLHVIYATAELEHAGRNLSIWDVERLRGDLSKDAKFYYASLWESLPPSLKDALRLVCALSFFWPKAAFGEIASKVGTAMPDVAKVEHLLHSSAAGLKVFHESLAVFVRATAGYLDRINELLPAVASWLDSSAPTALRVNWLWTVQARLGAPKNLIAGLTRDWIMLRLEEGYPESLFDTLLSEALIAALDTNQFADAFRLEHLRARMVGGSQFQMQNDDMARLISFTLILTADEGVVREALASRHEADILRLAAIGLALRARGDTILAETCGEEALRRFRGLSRFSGKYASIAGSDELKFLVDAFARLGAIGATSTALARLAAENGSVVWLTRVHMLIDEGNLDDLMTAAASLPPGESKSVISDACVRAAATAGVSITERDDFNELARTPLVAALETAHTRVSKSLNEPIPIEWLKGNYYERKEDLAILAHHWFFSAVHLSLCMAAEGQTAFEFIRAPTYEKRKNITDFLNALSAVAAQVAHDWWRGKFVDFHELFELLKPVEFRRFRQGHDASSAAEDFRSALHRIACDIRLGSILLDHFGEVALTEETMQAAGQSAWFDSSSFRTQYAVGLLTRMSDEAAAAFVQSQRALLDAEIRQETSVHLQTPLQLCSIALTHRLNTSARELCKQTWELTTGFAHRKDPTLNNTVNAIGYLTDVAPDDARRLLSLIAPQIHRILDYTDGKGTIHVLAAADRLLAKLSPSALIVKYEEHTHAGDWWQAENSLHAYVEQGIKDGWPLDALLRTGLHPETQDLLKRLAQVGSSSAAERLRVLREHAGWDAGVLQRSDAPGGDSESKPYAGNVTTFAPEQLGDLLDSLSASYNEKTTLLRVWYQHWDKIGQGRRLLAALDGLLLSEDGWREGVLVLSDLAFQTKRKLSGVNAAWKYLVQAHIRSGAWGGFAENEEKTRGRLDLVVQHYPLRCDEFVAATTYGMFGNPEPPRVAPSEVMVYFYVRQKQIAKAVKFAETMVRCVIEDTRTLPLERPRWESKLVSQGDGHLIDELHILIARLGWPSTSARWWTMQELAALLGEPDSRAKTESALLQLLNSRKLEAEMVEVLYIFWMAAQAHGYPPAPKLAESVSRPSILSDLLLESLGLLAEGDDEKLEEVSEEFEIPQDFDGVQGSDLPRIFRTSMSKLEHLTRLPFVRQMAFEWTTNQASYPDASFQGDPGHFLRPLGDGFVGQLSSRTALRAISAYLRTLAVAEGFWAMPPRRADAEALLALPVHPTLAMLRPQRPTWFPESTDFDGDTKAIEASLGALFARVQAARPGDELIAFSSPIVVSMGRCMEVSIVRWSQAVGSEIADADLAAHLGVAWNDGRMLRSATLEPLSTKTLLVLPHHDQLMEGKCKAWPLAAPLGLERLGYLQHDLYPGRLFFPTLSGYDEAEITPRDGQLEIKVDEQVVADLCYWNAGWGPVRPMQFDGNCGTALISRGTSYREGAVSTSGPLRTFYLWQVRTLHRSNTFDRFSQTLVMGAMFI
ncbi:ATP-binding protein [Duganella sp. HH105]|uniref:ATP-binding protein n=1 Tax=Duganella sp. HH105 TaxID=1781067 RepID=UPI0008937E29|nr:ATP-binding protein [Duganella sp. HH105]OEZ62099.1 NACHT domain protein [Duganella sp. HH105]